MRRLMTLGLGALCLLLTASQAQALMAAPNCTSDADCVEGNFCNLEACADPSGSPGTETEVCWGWCQSEGAETTVDVGTPESECEADSDCAAGFACVDMEAWAPITINDPVCPEGEKCGDEEGGSAGAPVEPVEGDPMPPEEPVTYKVCEPKSCDTDAECGADLLCVLETYGCGDKVDIEIGTDCAPGEECSPPGAPPEDENDECVEETVGHCAPRWLAPCQADVDCGPGFACVEEEVCWGWSNGSAGSPGKPVESDACDPGDENCAGTDSGGDPAEPGAETDPGRAGAPCDPEFDECGDEPTSVEGCESTGEFYCEPLMVDCSESACPEGLICVEMGTMEADDCWETSDGETNCTDDASEVAPIQVCLPENFEDWDGHGGGGTDPQMSSEDGSGPLGGNDGPATVIDEGTGTESGTSGGSGGGCAGGSSHAPLGTLAMALLALGLVTRRRSMI